MVKSLKDSCLHCVECNLDKIPNLQEKLPTLYKELLIERLGNHDRFQVSYLPSIYASLFCENLRYLKLYHCDQVDDKCLVAMSMITRQLETITVHRCINVTDAGIQALTTRQTTLRKLKLRKLPKFAGSWLCQVRSPALWKVDFRGCTSLNVAGVSALLKNNPSIKHITLTDCHKIDESIFHIVATCLNTSLELLQTELNTVSDESLLSLAAHCPNLKKLDLNGCTRVGKDALIKLFQGCTHLESLDLSYCNRLRYLPESEVMWTLPQTLRELSLCGLLLDNEDIFVECLQRLRSLTSIRLCGVPALNDDTLTRILEHIGADLTELDLSGGLTRILTDTGLKAVTKYCPMLESLSLSLLTMPTGKTLMPIFDNRDRSLLLKTLNLSCNMLDMDFLYKMADSCSNLTQLDLSGLRCVTDDLISKIANNCKRLSIVHLKGCRQVTDIGVCELARCCPLRRLNVSGINNLTDRSIFALANGNPYLEEICLNGCSQVSPMALKYLKDCCVPRLFYRHCVPNAGPNLLMAKNLDTGEFCRADLLSTS